jgi:hypothetical protein
LNFFSLSVRKFKITYVTCIVFLLERADLQLEADEARQTTLGFATNFSYL